MENTIKDRLAKIQIEEDECVARVQQIQANIQRLSTDLQNGLGELNRLFGRKSELEELLKECTPESVAEPVAEPKL